ncbi:hypothetical protein [Streptodolium elevatio]
MLDHHDGDGARQRRDQAREPVGVGGRQARGRLVEQQHLRFA